MISDRARDLIIEAEISSKGVYDKKYRHPEWPGGRSGVTIGIGYDLGMASKDKIQDDWQDLVPTDMLQTMLSCSGVSGEAAHSLCDRVKSAISIDWDLAIKVFDQNDVPQWEALVIKHIPMAAHLNPDLLGVLVSLAYNRGASFDNTGDRYGEMRAIKAAVQSGELDKVPYQLRSMKRLWPDMRGLRDRREAEAKLWEDGMKTQEVTS